MSFNYINVELNITLTNIILYYINIILNIYITNLIYDI